MKTMWRGAISFGLVNIGVRLYAATEDHDYHFHQIHSKDHGRIRYKRVCTECGEDVDFADIVKGYETADGKLVVLDSEDFRQLPIKTDRAIDLLEFVSVEQVDPVYFQKTYYLEPDKSGLRPYVLLRTALERTERLALVKITMRQRETLATIRARDGVLTLHTMLWPDEIRAPDFGFLKEETNLSRQELNMATSLVENMSEDFEPNEFGDDEYRRALQEMIEAKAQGAEPATKGEDQESGQADVVDLESALERSLSQSRGKKSAGSKGASKKSERNTAASSKTAKKGSTRSKSSRSSTASVTGSAQGGSRKRGA